MVTKLLENSFQVFPSSTDYRIWITVSRTIANRRWHPRVGTVECFDIAKEPCLQFFNRDPVEHLNSPSGICLRLCSQAGIPCQILHSLLEIVAILTIFVKKDNDSPVWEKPTGIALEAIGKLT